MENRPEIRKNKPNGSETQPGWARVLLLAVLAYEGVGSLFGGALLVAAPDGSYMDMPISIMNGAFRDFLLPGILLLGLGILLTSAFFAVLRRAQSDALLAAMALGGLSVWFATEIIILGQLHWLHAMWGLPVAFGWIAAIPLLAVRNNTGAMHKTLLACGLFSTIWYVIVNITFPLLDNDYSAFSMTISELSAKGTITRTLWVLLSMPYPLLLAAFGWGILRTAANNRAMRRAGATVLIFSVLNLYWPPMHQRTVIAGGGGTLTDALHIAWSIAAIILMLFMMGFGAAAMKGKFRIFTLAIVIIFIVAGVFIGTGSAAMAANEPTPFLGIWERISIASVMLWIGFFSVSLVRGCHYPASNDTA